MDEKRNRKRRALNPLPLAYTQFLHAQTQALAAFADMPIKYRNVLLPAITPTLQYGVEVSTKIRQQFKLRPQANESLKNQEYENLLLSQLATAAEGLLFAFELALHMKAIPAGRVAQVCEALVKVNTESGISHSKFASSPTCMPVPQPEPLPKPAGDPAE